MNNNIENINAKNYYDNLKIIYSNMKPKKGYLIVGSLLIFIVSIGFLYRTFFCWKHIIVFVLDLIISLSFLIWGIDYVINSKSHIRSVKNLLTRIETDLALGRYGTTKIVYGGSEYSNLFYQIPNDVLSLPQLTCYPAYIRNEIGANEIYHYNRHKYEVDNLTYGMTLEIRYLMGSGVIDHITIVE